jgi:hypothetical protein
VSAAERSRGWQIVAAISIVILVATIVVVLFVGSLGVLFKLGVFVFMGSNNPRILDPWLQYSPVITKHRDRASCWDLGWPDPYGCRRVAGLTAMSGRWPARVPDGRR